VIAVEWSNALTGGFISAVCLSLMAGMGWFIRWKITRHTETTAEQKKDDATVTVAAMGLTHNIITAYAQEVRAVNAEMELMRVRHQSEIDKLQAKIDRLLETSGEAELLYYRALSHIDFLERHIRKTDPEWPGHTLPKELREPNG
jgi:hypothetical protein